MSIDSTLLSNHLILCHSLLLLSSIFPSIRVFSSESALCIRWPKYWSFSFSISPSKEYSGLISSFRVDWFDLLAVQGTLKSLLQHLPFLQKKKKKRRKEYQVYFPEYGGSLQPGCGGGGEGFRPAKVVVPVPAGRDLSAWGRTPILRPLHLWSFQSLG